MTHGPRNGEVSWWWRDVGGRPGLRPALARDLHVDVAIVGAGFTGLWTAYALKRAEPSLRVAVVEREFAGFGASGRNGGWLTAEFGWSRERYAARAGKAAVQQLERALIGAVDEVIAVAAAEGIEADIVRTGALRIATDAAQAQRLRQAAAEDRAWGQSEADLVELNEAALRDRVRVSGAVAADWTPHAARIHPAKLVSGLAVAVERLGVPIFEGTPVTAMRPHHLETPGGHVRADWIVRATEGFTATLPGLRRAWLPMNSAMIVTKPLNRAQWDGIGWDGCELIGDMAHAYLYAQRTTDGRIAIGGRGIPYRYGSRLDHDGRTQPTTIDLLRASLVRLFPQLAGVELEHAWCGVLAVPRDWCACVWADPATGMAHAGGYVGTGVAASNLAGRTLRSLILDRRDDPEHRLAWVQAGGRSWEPEPLRWLGVRGVYALYRAADQHERARSSPRTSAFARVAEALAGR